MPRSWVRARSGQTKYYIIKYSVKQAVRAHIGWLGIRIMYLSGATCLPDDSCFSELALQKSNEAFQSSTKRHHHRIEMQLVLVVIQLYNCKQQLLAHSLPLVSGYLHKIIHSNMCLIHQGSQCQHQKNTMTRQQPRQRFCKNIFFFTVICTYHH